MSRIKYPLNIYVVWHPDCEIGKKLGEEIYSTFCRDYTDPLSRGMGIPVYFRYIKLDNNQPLSIDTSSAEKNAIILLIDEEFFLDEDYKDYVTELSNNVNSNNRIFPISLYNKAHNIGCNLSKLQFVDAIKFEDKKLDLTNTEDYKKSIRKIKTELLHDCSRLLISFQPTDQDKEEDRIGSPVKLFLSHAKLDGEITTLKFKKFIENNLKLDVFFDTVDIANGYDFAAQFEKEIKHSALVVLHTDEYSSREWCRREVIIAKKYKSPIVVVHGLKEGEKRAFPYLGNMPTITLLEDEFDSFYRIVSLTLYQVLNNLYQYNLLLSYKGVSSDESMDINIITSPPELFNFLDINQYKKKTEKKIMILYPDPPLGVEELNILNELDENIHFVTPITFET